MVVGAESIGESGAFDSLLLESSSSSSTSSSSAGLTWVTLISVSSGTDSLDRGSWLAWDLSEPRMLPQPFVRLLFSFTCGFERMQPLKSSAPISLVKDGAGVEGGDTFFALGLTSEANLDGSKTSDQTCGPFHRYPASPFVARIPARNSITVARATSTEGTEAFNW